MTTKKKGRICLRGNAANLHLVRGTQCNGLGETHPSAALREPRAIKSRTIVNDGSGSATHGRVRDHLSVQLEVKYIGRRNMDCWFNRGLPASLWRPLPALAAHGVKSDD